MSHRLSRWLLPAAFLTLASLAGAAGTSDPSHPAKPDPLDASAPVPRAVHRSALAGYRVNRDTELRSWRDANDEVARIGGWRAYAREAARPDAAATPLTGPASAPAPKPAASGAAGHKHH